MSKVEELFCPILSCLVLQEPTSSFAACSALPKAPCSRVHGQNVHLSSEEDAACIEHAAVCHVDKARKGICHRTFCQLSQGIVANGRS